MAVTSFIRTVWNSELLAELRKEKVSEAFVNHNYSGDVMQAGSVKINKLSDVTLRTYDGSTPITTEAATTAPVTLNIDRDKYFSVSVDDVDAAQAAGDLRGPIVASGANAIADDLDYANFYEMAKNVDTSAQAVEVKTSADAKALLLAMKKEADKNNLPKEGRVFVADYDFESLLLADSNIALSPATADTQVKGYVGTLYGIAIYSSNNLPAGEDVDSSAYEDDERFAILTHPSITTEATQIDQLEALRSETSFKDIIRGLCVSGRKTLNGKGVIAKAVKYTVGE